MIKLFFYGHCAATESLACTLKDVDQLAGESTEMVQAHQAGNQLNNNFPLETTPTMHMTACEDHFVPVALSQHSVVVPPFDSSLSLMLHDSSLLSDLSLSLSLTLSMHNCSEYLWPSTAPTWCWLRSWCCSNTSEHYWRNRSPTSQHSTYSGEQRG